MEASLVERLGHPADTPLVILNCDDFGSLFGANVAIVHALRTGAASSTTLMVPCPWASHAAAIADPSDDIGVHLTVTSEWAGYRWGPITSTRTLCAPDGRMHRTVTACHDAVVAAGGSGIAELRAECAAQVEQALAWGIDVTHVDAHMGTMQTHDEFLEVYLDVAAEYRLPLRMMSATHERKLGIDGRRPASERGLLFPDQLMMTYLDARPVMERALTSLRPGVTEFLVHPSLEGDELRAACDDGDERVANNEFLHDDQSFASQAAANGAVMIGFRPLRELQRGTVPQRETTTPVPSAR